MFLVSEGLIGELYATMLDWIEFALQLSLLVNDSFKWLNVVPVSNNCLLDTVFTLNILVPDSSPS